MNRYEELNQRLNEMIDNKMEKTQEELKNKAEQMKNNLLNGMEEALGNKDIMKAIEYKIKLDTIKSLGL